MLFRLHFHYRDGCYYILSAVTSQGKVFYSARDVGLALRHPQTEAFVREVASVRLGVLFPDIRVHFAEEWVIEQFSLIQLLNLRRTTLSEGSLFEAAVNLWCLLHFRNLDYVGNVPGDIEISQLDECCQDRGKPLSSWVTRFREMLLLTDPVPPEPDARPTSQLDPDPRPDSRPTSNPEPDPTPTSQPQLKPRPTFQPQLKPRPTFQPQPKPGPSFQPEWNEKPPSDIERILKASLQTEKKSLTTILKAPPMKKPRLSTNIIKKNDQQKIFEKLETTNI